MNVIPRKHHSFIASGIVYSCCALINNTCNELVIFPGITFYSGNNSILLCCIAHTCICMYTCAHVYTCVPHTPKMRVVPTSKLKVLFPNLATMANAMNNPLQLQSVGMSMHNACGSGTMLELLFQTGVKGMSE